MRPRINRTKPSTAPPINVLKRIGGAVLFSRYVPRSSDYNSTQNDDTSPAERPLEYGAEYRNAVYYAATPEAAIAGLKRQLANRTSSDDEILTMKSGVRAGLEETCIRQFCADNDLDPASSLTRRDLRKAVLKRRALNCAQYRAGLGMMKIMLNCR